MRIVTSIFVISALSALTLAGGSTRVASADATVTATTTVADGSGADCMVKGKGVLEKGVMIYSEREGGTAIAGFATQEVNVEVSDFPADTAGRAKIRTGASGSSVRMEGWVDATKIPISARSDIPVVEGHVWIGKGQNLKLRGSSPGKLTVEATLAATDQKLKGKAACNMVNVGGTTGVEFEVPKTSKKWVIKGSSLDLFGDATGGATVFTIMLQAPESGILLFSEEQKGAYTHVEHRGAAVIDAWAKTSDLKLFPKGEMLDALAATGMVTISPAKLKVDGSTKEVTATKDAPIRLSANDSAKAIGTVQSGAVVIVIDTVAGWSRIFPKTLEVIPPDGKDFWVKAVDLGG